MSAVHAEAERPIPTPILVGGGLVMLVSLLLVAFAREGVAPRQVMPTSRVAATLDFRLAPAAGGLAVRRAVDGRMVAVLPAKDNDFLPSLAEKLYQERALYRMSDAPPIRLVRWSDGRVTLDDPETGRELQLDSFGAGNAADAARLIEEGARR